MEKNFEDFPGVSEDEIGRLFVEVANGLGIDAAPDILQFVPQLFRNLFGSSLVVSFLVVFLLNILIPKDDTPEE